MKNWFFSSETLRNISPKTKCGISAKQSSPGGRETKLTNDEGTNIKLTKYKSSVIIFAVSGLKCLKLQDLT